MSSRTAMPVAVLNRSSVLSDTEVSDIVDALRKQGRHFDDVWGIDWRLNFASKKQISRDNWGGRANLVALDNSDVANALGYHDLTPDGFPLGKVFAHTVQNFKGVVSATFSHELAEMALDPRINLTAEDTSRGVFVAYEACDSVEADALGYEIDGVLVSDFVTPEFFDPTALSRPGSTFCYGDRTYRQGKAQLSKPFQLASGGYELIYVPGRGWTQNVRNQGTGHLASDRPRVGSRRERRMNLCVLQRSIP